MSDSLDKSSNLLRREFLKIGGTATAAFVAGTVISTSAEMRPLPPLPTNAASETMPTRNLGKTGYKPCIFSLGGQAAIEQPNNEAIAVPIVERAIDLGVNYIDTAAAYGGPERWSQKHIGVVMKRRRKEVFLASKTHDRTRDGSLKLLDESLKLLNTDHLDLWQLHNISRMEQVNQIFGKNGAIEALQQARNQNMVRYLGVTGHADPEVLMEMIRRFPFDTILMAVNAADTHKLSFTEKLLPLAVEKQMGIIGMKIPARGRILASWDPKSAKQGGFEGTFETPGKISMKDAMYYTLSLPVSTVIIGCDNVKQVEENIQSARTFTPLSNAQLQRLAAQTEPIARQALFFRKWS